MKKLYLNIIWPGLLIGFLHPFSEKISSFYSVSDERTEVRQGASSLAMEPSAGLPDESSESVCAELFLDPGNPQGVLQLPAFNPAKGQLTGIQITTEGTLIADIRRSNLSSNNFQALFSADLQGTFPDGLKFGHTTKVNYQASMSSEHQRQSGISALVEETTTETRKVTEDLERFYGAGNLEIPLEAINLINLKAQSLKYSTQLKARVCIDYSYQAN